MVPSLFIVMALFTQGALAQAPLDAVAFTDVKLTPGFWSFWMDLTPKEVLPHCVKFCESEGKLDNFLVASGRKEGQHRGAVWEDSDVYKVIEGAAYCLALKRDPAVEQQFDAIIDSIAAAQQPDGYIDTYFTLKEPNNRWTDDSKHETYCAGHLIEAAVAYYQATGKRQLLDVATRLGDHMYDVFGPGKQTDVSQHEEIELALVKLWRLTKNDKYLELANLFLDRRGHREGRKWGGPDGWGETCQDHKPVREQTEIFGHAVRAMYLYCGVTDIAAMTGDPGYLDTLDAIWRDVTGRKMYVTGGIGDSSKQNEGFSIPYYLPNDTAYCETCASIGMALWNQRMAMLHADAKYADIVEREIYNGILGSTSMDGHGYYYCNRLQGDEHRPPWQGCACCPTNMVRFLPSIAGYAYATGKDSVYVNQYIPSETRVNVAGKTVGLTQQTRYPWDGKIEVKVMPSEPLQFALRLRIPSWCQGSQSPDDLYTYRGKPEKDAAKIAVNGTDTGPLTIEKGYAVIARQWSANDAVTLDLPMPVQRVCANEKVEADRELVAFQRGPVVYCFEDVDNEGNAGHAAIPAGNELTAKFEADLLNGVTTLTGTGLVKQAEKAETVSCSVKAIPFYARDNRGQNYMQVWMPEDPARSKPKPKPTIASASRVRSSFENGDRLSALNDQIEPKSSKDLSIPRQTWWDRRGTQEWVQYNFGNDKEVSTVEVYWFDDTGVGSCRVPKSWRVLYRDGQDWRPVDAKTGYETKTDTFNRVEFKPVRTNALRVEVQLQPEMSGGILEWRVF